MNVIHDVNGRVTAGSHTTHSMAHTHHISDFFKISCMKMSYKI